MADEPAPQESKKRSPVVLTLTIVAGVALLEGAAFFAAMKFIGAGPQVSHGADDQHVLEAAPAEEELDSAEIVLLKRFKVPNDKKGQTIIYDFDISVSVPAARKEQVEGIVKNRGGEISDRVAQTIRRASARVLEEDDFGTLRLQLKQALSEIVGDDQTIRRVLIPRCVPMKTD